MSTKCASSHGTSVRWGRSGGFFNFREVLACTDKTAIYPPLSLQGICAFVSPVGAMIHRNYLDVYTNSSCRDSRIEGQDCYMPRADKKKKKCTKKKRSKTAAIDAWPRLKPDRVAGITSSNKGPTQ
ncbi:unnamed protein product, partial [Ectocarpus sp. 12 AP-2014]